MKQQQSRRPMRSQVNRRTSNRRRTRPSKGILSGLLVCLLVLSAVAFNTSGSLPSTSNQLSISDLIDASQVNLVPQTDDQTGLLFPIVENVPELVMPESTIPELSMPDSILDSVPDSIMDKPINEIVNEFVDENEVADEVVNEPDPFLHHAPWQIAKVNKGDTLSQIFKRQNISSDEAYAIAKLKDAAPLLAIKPGEKLKFKIRDDGKLGILQYPIGRFETLSVSTENSTENSTEKQNYEVELQVQEPEIRINNAKATIYTSLLAASAEVGVATSTMYDFISMFGWQVDFAMDLWPGDQFSLIYEQLYLDNKKVGDGEIIAAELTVSGKRLQAIRHIDDEGVTNYYAPNGDGIKGEFLRTPMEFSRISSSFSKRRLHPIKKVWRAHKGVDYVAPRGTPVKAAGDGTIKLAQREGGYGKTVIIRHGGKYETLYAHLSGYGKGIKRGKKVQQGDIIGYVGSTGLSTGPHLHYEFRVNGVHKNPVTVELPKSAPIDKKFMPGFKLLASRWSEELDHLSRIPLAQNLVDNEKRLVDN